MSILFNTKDFDCFNVPSGGLQITIDFNPDVLCTVRLNPARHITDGSEATLVLRRTPHVFCSPIPINMPPHRKFRFLHPSEDLLSSLIDYRPPESVLQRGFLHY